MNTNKDTITDHEELQDAAEQKRHPVVAVRNLLPSIISQKGEPDWSGWSKETVVATAAVVITIAALVALYIYGASIAA